MKPSNTCMATNSRFVDFNPVIRDIMSSANEADNIAAAIILAYEAVVRQNREQNLMSPETVEIDRKTFLAFEASSKVKHEDAELRRIILSSLTTQRQTPWRILQVIGDSGTAFDSGKIALAGSILHNHIDENTVLEYGFSYSEHDANWIVSNHISKDQAVAPRTLANVVGQSIEALNSPGWFGSRHVAKFVLLYREDGSYTNFGEDTWLSDSIMAAEFGDEVLCFEGGVQAFRQCCTILAGGIKVVAVSNLRGVDSGPPRFSAAELLISLSSTDAAGFEEHISNYLSRCPLKNENQHKNVYEYAQKLVAAKQDLSQLVIGVGA